MNVSLTKQIEKFISQQVKTGQYSTASEVVREALRLMKKRDADLEWLRREVQIGLNDIRAGRVSELDVNEIKREGRRRNSRQHRRSA